MLCFLLIGQSPSLVVGLGVGGDVEDGDGDVDIQGPAGVSILTNIHMAKLGSSMGLNMI